MKIRFGFVLLFALYRLTVVSQDPRAFNHGVCVVPYEQNDSAFYYITWSSADESWEHDIYNKTVFFTENGTMVTDSPSQVYIGSGADEAQEPVNAAIDFSNNHMLSVWEDGIEADGPNVHGQLHMPNGNVVRSNWQIAGGVGAQHSAYTTHLGNTFLIFYADEAPPSTGGAVLKAKVLDDSTGDEWQSISLTPNDEDNWWPVAVSDSSQQHTLALWGNDGYAARGTVLYQGVSAVEMTADPQDYLVDIQQYFYQVAWLEKLSQFIVVARNGAYENMTDESQICLIDTLGNRTYWTTVAGGILREAKMAVHWNSCDASYTILYPSNINHLTSLRIDSTSAISSVGQIINHPDLENHIWPSTGIWSTFVRSVQSSALEDPAVVLFAMNDTLSNDVVLIPVHIEASLFCGPLSIQELSNPANIVYPNPTSDILRIDGNHTITEWILYDIMGEVVAHQKTKNTTKIDLHNYPRGLYVLHYSYWDHTVFIHQQMKVILTH